MAIRGSLREASLPDVLQLLAMGKKSGCLSVTHRHAFGSIWFAKGRVVFASVVNRRDRLGDILVKHGVLARADLDHAIAVQASAPERRIGEILVSEGLITREELHEHMRGQIEEAVYHLFTWNQGTFAFEPDVAPDAQDFLVAINPESLLLEGARRIDEWELIRKKISSFDLIFALDRAHLADARVDLTVEQEAMVPLLDGRRDVAAIVEETGLPEFAVAKALFELATAGFLHRVGRADAAPEVTPDARVSEHRNLGIAFYRSGMFDEAAREFRRVLELRPDDEHAEFHGALVAVRQGRFDDAVRGFQAVTARSPSRGAAHLNLAFSLGRLGRDEECRASLARAAALLPDHPAVRLSQAARALRDGDVEQARAAAGSAAGGGEGRAPAAWYHYAAMAEARGGNLERAVSILRTGTAAWPHAPELANNLAVALERLGSFDEAAAVVERALHDGPSVAQLNRNSGDLHCRAGRDAEALDAYARAVRLAPDRASDAWLKLGNIRFRRGEVEDAERCWERCVTLAPANAGALRRLQHVRGGG